MTATAPALAPDLVAALRRLKLSRIRAIAPEVCQAAKTQRRQRHHCRHKHDCRKPSHSGEGEVGWSRFGTMDGGANWKDPVEVPAFVDPGLRAPLRRCHVRPESP